MKRVLHKVLKFKYKLAALLLSVVMLFSFINFVSYHGVVDIPYVKAAENFSQNNSDLFSVNKNGSMFDGTIVKRIELDFQGGSKNDGEEDLTSETIFARDNDTVVLNTPTRQGYAFYGYFSEPDACGEQFYDYRGRRLDQVSLNNSSPDILYAAWAKLSSAVTTSAGESIKIDEHSGHVHSPDESIGLDISRLVEIGYTKIEVNMQVYIRAQDKGDGRNMWFDILTEEECIFTQDLLKNADLQYTEWETTYATVVIDINKFSDASTFGFGFEQSKRYFWTDAIWWFNKAECYFTATEKIPMQPLSSDYELLHTDSYNLEDNTGYNINGIYPTANPLGGNYTDIGLQVNGGSIIKGDVKNGIQQYGYVVEDKLSDSDEVSIELLLNYNFNTITNINGSGWEISGDSYSGAINGISGAGVVQTGALLVQKLKPGGNPNNPNNWTWENPISSGLTESFHTVDFTNFYSPTEYNGNSHYVKRSIPVIKRDAEGNYVYKYDENDPTKIIGVEYEKDINGNYIFQDIYENIDGYVPIFTFDGSELAKEGLTLKVLFVYELKQKTGKNWNYTNVCEETTLTLYPSSAKILFQNMNFTSSSNDEEAQESETGSSELIRQFGTVKDGHSVNDGFRVNFNGNETYTVEYYKNNATNTIGKKYVVDGQIFMEPGKYRFVVTPKVGMPRETIIYINERGVQQNLEKYFGEGLISEDSHRIFSQTDAIPVYLSDKTYWSTLAYDDYSAPLVGRIGFAIDEQTEYWEERVDEDGLKYYVNYIILDGQILYEEVGYFKRESGDEKFFFKIIENVDASDRLAKGGKLSEVGNYYCEFATNKDFFDKQENLSGDIYNFIFQFRITDKPSKPYINEQLLKSNLSFVDYNSVYYAVDLPTVSNHNVTYAFNTNDAAYAFSYSYQRSLVKVGAGIYVYEGKTYVTQSEVLEKVEDRARASISKRYFDASDVDSFLTTQGNVHCAIDADGKATLQIREAIKDDEGNITGYNSIGTIWLTKSVIVFDDSFSIGDYVQGEPFLNDKPYSYLNENGVVVNGFNSVRFVQVAEYESTSVRLTHVDSGLNWIIPYGVPVQEFLVSKNAPSGRYKIAESNLDAVNEYYGVYISPGENTTELSITRVNRKNQTTQILTKSFANIRFENINALILNFATNELDPYGIVKVINLGTGVTETMRLDEVSSYKIEEQGHYQIDVIDRFGNISSFYADIYDATKFYNLTFVNNGETINTNTVGGGTRVNLPILKAPNDLVEFIGWQDDSGRIISGDYFYYDYTENVTLTAVWHFKNTTIIIYDGDILKEYQVKPGVFVKLEDLYGTSKDGLTYFRYVYEDEDGVKYFYLPQIQSVPNVQTMSLETLWRDEGNPIIANSGDKLTAPTKEGYIFYAFVSNDNRLFYDIVDVDSDSLLTLYALYTVAPNYASAGGTGIFAGLTEFFDGPVQRYGLPIGGTLLSVIFAAFVFAVLQKRKKTQLLSSVPALTYAPEENADFVYVDCQPSQNVSEKALTVKPQKYSRKRKFALPKLGCKKFMIPVVSLFMTVIFAFIFNVDGINAVKFAAEAHAQEFAIEREVEEYKEYLAEEQFKRSRYIDKTTEAYNYTNLTAASVQEQTNASSIEKSGNIDFLNNLVGLNLEDLGFYVYKTTINIGDKDVVGWLYTQGTFAETYNAYLAGFVAFANEEFDYWLVDEYVVEFEGNQFVFIYNEMINTMHYVAFDKYVYYSVDDYEISFDIVAYSEAEINYKYGYLYNYDLSRAEYDPDLEKELDLTAYSTLKGIDYDFALDYYNTVIANQDQYAVTLDSVTVLAIDVAALNEAIINGQEEAFLGISSDQIYYLESQLANVSFYYVDGETGALQAIDIQDILDRYYAEAHKDDVTFLQILNWVLIGAQIIGGVVLCCIPGGQIAGASLIASGVLGIVSEFCGPQIQEIIGGLGVSANGISAISIGIQLLSKWPAGTIAGIVCIGVGAGTAFFGINDITEGIWGDNLIKDVWGMNEEAYQWTELGLNIASTVCAIGGNMLKSKLTQPKLSSPIDVSDDIIQPKPTSPDVPEVSNTSKGTKIPSVKEAARQGRSAHANARSLAQEVYGVSPNNTEIVLKHPITNKRYGRLDAIDFDNNIIFELKPNNSAAIAKGRKQLERYIQGMRDIYNKECMGKIIVYDIVDGKFIYTLLD